MASIDDVKKALTNKLREALRGDPVASAALDAVAGTGKAHSLVCCFCGRPIEGFGHNPDTARARWGKRLGKERCCDRCNWELVTPARMGLGAQALGTWEEAQAMQAQAEALQFGALDTSSPPSEEGHPPTPKGG